MIHALFKWLRRCKISGYRGGPAGPDQPISPEARVASELSEGSDVEVSVTVREPAEGQLSILVTHTCDIIKPPVKYPRVEVLRCYTEEDQNKLRDADTNSARYFLVDPNTGLVADVATRTSIEKAILLARQPIGWPSSEVQFKRFRNWLGSRYTRPIEPDEVVEILHKPISKRVGRIRKRNINNLSETLDLVKRIHVLRKNSNEPYDVTLLFFVEEENWEAGKEKVPDLVEDLREHLSPERVILSHEVTTEARISLRDYLATTYLDLDSYSYEGEEGIGAEPIRSV